jgi:hypothetical protein
LDIDLQLSSAKATTPSGESISSYKADELLLRNLTSNFISLFKENIPHKHTSHEPVYGANIGSRLMNLKLKPHSKEFKLAILTDLTKVNYKLYICDFGTVSKTN